MSCCERERAAGLSRVELGLMTLSDRFYSVGEMWFLEFSLMARVCSYCSLENGVIYVGVWSFLVDIINPLEVLSSLSFTQPMIR